VEIFDGKNVDDVNECGGRSRLLQLDVQSRRRKETKET
jgi:hypothetical protein